MFEQLPSIRRTILLASGFKFPCGLSVRNRIVKASMTECLAGPDGHANELHSRLYDTFAEGGAGLMLTGNVLIDSRYLEAPGNVVIENGRGLPQLVRWAAAATSRGTAVIMQLNHAGRQTPRSAARESVAPSAVPLTAGKFFSTPREITEKEILETIERFAYAAEIAERAGFSGVEVHAAHGYLFSQFLSPRVNRRADQWGGSIENRARILIRTVTRIREMVSSGFAVGVKLNVDDFIKGGLTPDDSLEVAKMLSPLGVDFIEVGGGTHEYAAAFELGYAGGVGAEGLYADYARKLRQVTSIPLILTGGLRARASMERLLSSGACDLVGMARPFAIEPDLPLRMLRGEAEGARKVDIKLLPAPRAAFSELIWARAQIRRLAMGLKPKPGMSAKWAVLGMLWRDRGFAKRQRAIKRRQGASLAKF